MIKDRLGAVPLVTQLPIGIETDFVGIVDLVEMKAIKWQEETLGAKFDVDRHPGRAAGRGRRAIAPSSSSSRSSRTTRCSKPISAARSPMPRR